MLKKSDEQNQKSRDDIKKAISEGDVIKLFWSGVDNIVNKIFPKSITFDDFLDNTSDFLDKYIEDVIKNESLVCIGGKMTLKVGNRSDASVVPIDMLSEIYFQNVDKEWIVKEKKGKINSKIFSDWKDNATVNKLLHDGKMELLIEPPKIED